MERVLVRFALVTAGIMLVGIMAPATQAGPVVRFSFDYSVTDSSGPINYFDVELFDTTAPITVSNFLQYVYNNDYNNTIIHRNVQNSDGTGFIVQGGGFTPTVNQGGVPTALNPIISYGPIQNEFSPTRSNLRGTIAMAKVGGDPNSATNQWFVNLGNNSANLDNQNSGFTVFGQVIGNGMTLIDAVNKLPTYDVSSYFKNNTFTEVPLWNNGSSLVTVKSAAVVPTTSSSTGSLSGFAYVDANHDGVMDNADYAIGDARVSLMQAGSNTPVATVYSAKDGSYHFNNLGPGMFSIKMQTPCDLPGRDNGKGQMLLGKDGTTIIREGTIGTVQQNAYGGIWLGDGQKGLNFNFAESAYPVVLISARMLLNTSTGIPLANAVAVPGTNATNLVANTQDATITRNVGDSKATLSGTGVGPVFSSDPVLGSILDFGAVPQASLKSLLLNISNASTDFNGGNTTLTDLTLLDAKITGTDSGLFSVVGFNPGTVLHEGDLLNLEVAYNGTGAHGPRSAVLTISTDEGAAIGSAGGNAFTYQISTILAPEPSSLVLLAIAGLFFGGLTWRRWAVRIR